MPWEKSEEYRRRSPLTYVGNVTTPTMLLTDEEDYRTPMSETKQFYQALKFNDVEAAMVHIPAHLTESQQDLARSLRKWYLFFTGLTSTSPIERVRI